MHCIIMRKETPLELVNGIKAAEKIAVAANVLYRLKVVPHRIKSEGTDSAIIEILLKLVKAGGKAPISSITARDVHQTVAVLKEMERNNLVKILETPFRTYVALTERGWKVYSELVNFLV